MRMYASVHVCIHERMHVCMNICVCVKKICGGKVGTSSAQSHDGVNHRSIRVSMIVIRLIHIGSKVFQALGYATGSRHLLHLLL